MASAVISGRVDDGIRRKADVAMRKAGLKPSDIIQNAWALIADAGEVPEVLRSGAGGERGQAGIARLERFLDSLPPANPAYADLTDDEILSTKTRDYA